METQDKLFRFLESKGFHLVDKSTAPQPFGNYYYDYSDGHLKFRLLNDRSRQFVDISCSENINACYDLALVRSLILHEEILNKKVDFNELIDYFIENYCVIYDLFSPSNSHSTIAKLDIMEEIRARQMFPGAFQ